MLDSIIHQPVRLRIMSVLIDLAPGDEVDFTHLKKVLGLRKPRTYVRVSGAGRDAYGAHVRALRAIIESGENGKE